VKTLEFCDHYLRQWLPSRLSETDHRLLGQSGIPVAIRLEENGEEREWVLLESGGELMVLGTETEAVCRFRLGAATFRDLIGGRTTAQRAFFTGRLRIEGPKLTALKLGSLLDDIFRRIPCRPEDGRRAQPQAARCEHCDSRQSLTSHQRGILDLHFDPDRGAPYWIERARRLGVRASDFVMVDDLAIFGLMDRGEMASRPFRDFLPICLQGDGGPLLLGETGGATGSPITVAWTERDFEAAFVEPLPTEIDRRGGLDLHQWLFVGPTGPHIIGKAADALARRTTGCDALKIDFDPRWHRRLSAGSPAAARHLEHLRAQARTILVREHVDALFVTPSLLRALLEQADEAWPARLRLVHLGGQSVTRDETAWLRERLPGECWLVNGYGNSLFGCLVEHDPQRPAHYRSIRDRLDIRIVNGGNYREQAAVGEWGRVLFHRFDASLLILNQLERDEALRTEDGLAEPRPAGEVSTVVQGGIY